MPRTAVEARAFLGALVALGLLAARQHARADCDPTPLTHPASASPELTFRATFDSDLDGDDSGGGRPELHARKGGGGSPPPNGVSFTAGVHGRAVSLDSAWLEYRTRGHLNPCRGSVSFWARPTGWKWRNDDFHVFFRAGSGNDSLLFYKYFKGDGRGPSNRLCFLVRRRAGASDSVPGIAILTTDVMTRWTDDGWHHFAATWAPGDLRLYVDGVLQDRASADPPENLGETFSIAPPMEAPSEGGLVLDDFRLYDGPIGASAVAEETAQGLRELLRGEHHPEAARLSFLRLPSRGQILVRADFSRVPAMEPRLASGSVEITRNGESVVRRPFSGLDAASAVTTALDVSDLAPGSYGLQAEAKDGVGNLIGRAQAVYEKRPTPEWAAGTLGRSESVTEPFIPLTVDGTTVRGTLVDADFRDTLVARQIHLRPDRNAGIHRSVKRFYAGADLLEGPITLVANVDGEHVAVAEARTEVSASSPSRVELSAKSSLKRLPVTSRIAVDYDGSIRVRLEVGRPSQDVALTEIALEIPLRGDLVKFLTANDPRGDKFRTFSGSVASWKGAWRPLVWVGNEYRGLCIVSDTSEGWLGELNAEDRMTLSRDRGVALLRLLLVPEAVPVRSPWSTEIWLCPTPARPMPEGWRGLSRDGTYRQPGHHGDDDAIGVPIKERLWWAGDGDMAEHYDYPVPRYGPARLREAWESSARVSDLLQQDAQTLWTNAREGEEFFADWSTLSTEELADSLVGTPPTGGRVDWGSSIKDFWLWNVKAMMDEGLDGLYLDGPYMKPSHSDRIGGAERPSEATEAVHYGIAGLRDYVRRVRVLAEEISENPWFEVHMSGQLMAPLYPSCDSFVNGELLRGKVGRHYLRALGVDQILAQYTGYAWGLAPWALPELSKDAAEEAAPTAEMLALLLPHDILIFRGNCSVPEVDRALRVVQKEFQAGAPDCSFLPYWEAGGILDPQPLPADLRSLPRDGTVVSSAWVRRGQALLIIANWGDDRSEKTWRVDWSALGLDGRVRCTDPISGAGTPCADGRFTKCVDGRSYSFLWARSEAAPAEGAALGAAGGRGELR